MSKCPSLKFTALVVVLPQPKREKRTGINVIIAKQNSFLLTLQKEGLRMKPNATIALFAEDPSERKKLISASRVGKKICVKIA